MAITEAALLVRAKKRTRRDELTVIGDGSNSDFTYYMKLAVKRLSQDSLSLKGTATGTVSASTDTVTIPSDMIDATAGVDGFTLGSANDSSNNPVLQPLSWEEYRAGKMEGYVLRDGVIFVRPKPDTDRTYNLDYRKFHGATVTTLEFADKYEECFVPLLCHYIYNDLELETKAKDQEVEYKRKLREVADDDTPPIVATRQRS